MSGQIRRLALYGTEGAVGRCRDFTQEALADWGWYRRGDEESRAVAEDILLVVSELVTNACLHAGGARALVLVREGERLRIEVTDSSRALPAVRPESAALPGGHGLRVVERLSRRWGAEPAVGGKTVWSEVLTAGRCAPA